jgi:hypothetical protein
MMKLIPRITILTLIVCCASFVAKAQLGYDYAQYDIGVAAGFDQVSGDAQTKTTTQSIHFNLTFNVTPYTNFVFEAQLGRLEGGDSLTTSTGRQFTNDFSAFTFRGQLQMGEIFDYSHSQFKNGLKNLYISTGIGYISNHITAISRYSIKTPGVFTGGLNNSMEPFIPFRIGYEFKIYNQYDQPSFKVDLGYEYNLVLGDNLDGFETGSHFDVYTQFVVGVKFAIGGGVISYRKKIVY